MKKVLFGIAVAFAAAHAGPAGAFPTKPVTLTVAFAPGGGVDQMARMLARPMAEALGQPVTVLNRPGGGGAVAATAVKNAPADGYTLAMTVATTFTVEPNVDFRHLGAVGEFQEAFVAQAGRPWRDMKGLVAHAKQGNELKYGSFIRLDRMITSIIAKKEGIRIAAVPMQGGAAVMPAVLGGHVDFGFSGGLHVSHVKAGTMVVLAGLGERRLDAFPDVPTLKELGYDVSLLNYGVISAPKGIPDAVARTLEAAILKAAADPEYVDLVRNKLALRHVALGAAEASRALAAQAATYARLAAETPN
jgi:tripartite-type tricarboxylate transporter receptor subunit TctC